jgi:hypothetical protein
MKICLAFVTAKDHRGPPASVVGSECPVPDRYPALSCFQSWEGTWCSVYEIRTSQMFSTYMVVSTSASETVGWFPIDGILSRDRAFGLTAAAVFKGFLRGSESTGVKENTTISRRKCAYRRVETKRGNVHASTMDEQTKVFPSVSFSGMWPVAHAGPFPHCTSVPYQPLVA